MQHLRAPLRVLAPWQLLAVVLASVAFLLAPQGAHANNVTSPPVVSLGASTTSPAPGEPVTFVATITDADGPNDPSTVEWRIGADTAWFVDTTSIVRTFTAGTHLIEVRATDTFANVTTAQLQLVVAYPLPSAGFTPSTLAPTTRTPVALDASSSKAPAVGATIVKYEWDFNGNGTYETSCAGPAAGATFSSGTTGVGLRVTDSLGGTSTSTMTISATKDLGPKVDPAALTMTVGGCSGDSGVLPPGSPAMPTCYTSVSTGIAEMTSNCFTLTVRNASSGSGLTAKLFDINVYSSTSKVRLNGIDLRPLSGAKIEVDTGFRTIATTRATVSLDSGTLLGKVTVLTGAFNWKMPTGKAGRFNIGSLPINDGAKLLGLDVEGDARLDLVYRGAELPVSMHLPKPLDVSANVVLRTDNTKGLRLDDVRLRLANATFGAFEVHELDIAYKVSEARFDGSAKLTVSAVGNIDVQVQVVGDTLTIFAANYSPVPPIVLGSGVLLNQIRFDYRFGPPLTLEGGVNLSAGPKYDGLSAAEVDGTLRFVASDPWFLEANGKASIVGVGLAKAGISYKSNGMFRMGGEASGNLYDIVSASGAVSFWLFVPTGQFNAEGRVDVCVWKGCGGGAVVISNVGIGGCVYTFFADFGMGYRWDGEFKGYLTGCDIGHWRSAWTGDEKSRMRAHSRADAVASEDVTIAPGQRAAFIRVEGATAPPRVRVIGPDGTRLEVPADTTEYYVKTKTHVILQVPPHKATYVMLADPAPGKWRVETIDGSSQIVGIHGANALPEPVVNAGVEGTGHSRRLRFKITPRTGQVVRFVERAGDVMKPIGVVRGATATGSFAFQAADGRAGRRTIVAIVEQDGMPRTTLDVATYLAPGPLLPSRPARVTVRRTATSAFVTWSKAALATRYRVVVTMSDGRRYSVVRRTRSLTLTSVARNRVLRVSVTGLRSDGRAGAARQVRSPLLPPRRAR